MEEYTNQFSIERITRKLFEKYGEIYDPTILKKSQILEMLKSLNLDEKEINEITNQEEKFLKLLFLWANIIFKEKVE